MIVHYLHKTVSLGLCAIALTVASAAAQTAFHVIAYRDRLGGPGGIVEGSPSLLYFATGTDSAILSITPQGTETVLTTFPSGYQMLGPVVSAPNGRFYDVVAVGANPANVFSVGGAAGSRQLYASQSSAPFLTQNLPDGNLLGTAVGIGDNPWYVASVGLKGAVTPIYQFPAGDVALTVTYASDGNYYGLAENGPGYLFRVTPSGVLTKLVSFPSGSVLPNSYTPLLQASDGNLYGVTNFGGTNSAGTVYKVTLSGQYTLLYTFPNDQNSFPSALIEGSDGNLYGATLGHITGGGHSELFRITKSGQYTLLFAMSNITAAGACQCSLVQGSDGNIYGTAISGGPNNGGVIFELELGLPIPAPAAQRFSPGSGAAGTQVLLWGSNLLSASVQFNGVAATTVSNSGSNYILATVPTGATTGPITITTPGGTVTTKENFTVE
ncbi:MAG TPA: choice-of-anchor tandem repeat GloVer-containing protein [Bryobacteraceae bacterium]|nr:choice-of-anchor tandem repeat GloVer-containing protein [Bryobacteraceae bacterium]